ncbi:MAG TPA: response regulator [Blastocatellia bacterium]|nr:response regulator [Blastocatellia bacterium]
MSEENTLIVAVDDEPVSLRLMEKVLQRYFRVVAVSSGQEALSILKREEVAVLITDQRMPVMTGTELLRSAQRINPNTVGLLVTSSNDNETFHDAIMNSGAFRVISKPWDPDKLTQVVEAALGKYRTRVENQKSIQQLRNVKESLKNLSR